MGVLAPAPARAEGEMAAYEAAVARLQQGTPQAAGAAAVALFELSEGSTLPAVRSQAEFQLGRALELKGYPVAASIYYSGVVREGPSHQGCGEPRLVGHQAERAVEIVSTAEPADGRVETRGIHIHAVRLGQGLDDGAQAAGVETDGWSGRGHGRHRTHNIRNLYRVL
jgi:hypothetical protein